jgi:hypothetical protein
MAYSQVSITNLALNRIGARCQITAINDNSPNAVKALMIWDAIFQEVLSERDWKFAKTRQQLQLSPVTPLYTWKYAWALPADFLRFVRPRLRQSDQNWLWMWGPEGYGYYNRQDPPFWPPNTDYRVETLTAGWDTSVTPPIPYGSGSNPPTPFPVGKYALTNYGGQYNPVAITYIQLITDYTQLMPGFVNCLTNRLAMELAIGVTEDKNKFQLMEERYKDSLNSAEAQNESMDYERDEQGGDEWVRAGRNADNWGGYR